MRRPGSGLGLAAALCLAALCSLVLFIGLRQIPRLAGEAVNGAGYDIEPDTIETGTMGILPEPDGTVVLVPQFEVPLFYGPTDLLWITRNASLDPQAAIPSALLSTYFSMGRLVTDERQTALIAVTVNSLVFSGETCPLSELEGLSYYTVRFGEQSPLMTVYENGYLTFSSWPFADRPVGVDAYSLLAEAYETAADHFSWVPFRISDDRTSLFSQVRLYTVGERQYITPLPYEAWDAFRQEPYATRSITADQVTDMVQLLSLLKGSNLVVHFGALGGHPAMQIPAEEGNLARLSYHWLLPLTDGYGLYSVSSQPDGAVITSPDSDNFWYFPQLSPATDGGELLRRYHDGARDEALRVPCFHFSQEGVLYYPRLADGQAYPISFSK